MPSSDSKRSGRPRSLRNVVTAAALVLGLAIVTHAQISVPFPNFVTGTVAQPSEVNANFSALANQALNRTGGTMTGTLTSQAIIPSLDNQYDFGDGTHRVKNAYIKGTTQLNGVTYTWPSADGSAGQILQTNGSGTLAWTAASPISVCDLHLTLETGVPYSTTDQTAKTSVFVSPVDGGQCSFYDGSKWTLLSNSEVTVAVPATTSTMYDLWCRTNSGTMACDTTAWTNDTTRATALTTQDRVYVKTGDTTRRYIGSFRTTAVSGQTEDSVTKRYVWSYYRRRPKPLKRFETTTSWTMAGAFFAQANGGAAANQVEVVVGFNDEPVQVSVGAVAKFPACASDQYIIAIGLDSTSVAAGDQRVESMMCISNDTILPVNAVYRGFVGVGRHTLVWLEKVGSSTATVYANGGIITGQTSGLSGQINN